MVVVDVVVSVVVSIVAVIVAFVFGSPIFKMDVNQRDGDDRN